MLLLTALPAYGQNCHDHLQYGIQDEQGRVDRLLRAFAVGYSNYQKTPLWVAYRDHPG